MLRHALATTAVFLFLSLSAQDTLRLDLDHADALLLERALPLLAQHFEVDKAEADRVQARVFNNPNLSTEWSVRPSTGSFFDVGQPQGQKAVTIEQLFRIGGQRGLAVKAATERTRSAEAQYAELVAALRFELHGKLYRQHYIQRSITAISSQLELLKRLVDGYGVQLEKGNVSLREATRLRASYFALNGDRSTLERELNDLQLDLRILLGVAVPVSFSPTTADLQAIRPLPSDTAALLATAEQTRPSVQAALAQAQASELELKYERRSTIPDLLLGGTYDQNSNYLANYTGLNVGLSIPIFDRNQGRIARARAEAGQARTAYELERNTVRNEVKRAYQNLASLQQQYASTTAGFADQLDHLSGSLVDNYVKSNINLIEFTDLFESYNASIIALNTLEADLQNAYEELEFVCGQRLFRR